MNKPQVRSIVLKLAVVIIILSTDAFAQRNDVNSMGRAEIGARETLRISKEMRKRKLVQKAVLDAIDKTAKKADESCRKVREKTRNPKTRRLEYEEMLKTCRKRLDDLWVAIVNVPEREERAVLEDAFEPGWRTLQELRRGGY